MERGGAGYTVVLIYVRHFQPVELAVLLQELPLYLDGLTVPLRLRTHAEVQGYLLRSFAGAVPLVLGIAYSSSGTNSEGSTSRALAILRMVEG